MAANIFGKMEPGSCAFTERTSPCGNCTLCQLRTARAGLELCIEYIEEHAPDEYTIERARAALRGEA